jgi:hypothetical protein
LIALNLDHPALDRPASATPILQHRGQFQQPGFIERDIGYGRHVLATPAFGFSPQSDHRGAFLGHS